MQKTGQGIKGKKGIINTTALEFQIKSRTNNPLILSMCPILWELYTGPEMIIRLISIKILVLGWFKATFLLSLHYKY